MRRAVTLRCKKFIAPVVGGFNNPVEATGYHNPNTGNTGQAPPNPKAFEEHVTPDGTFEIRPPHLQAGNALKRNYERPPPPHSESISDQMPQPGYHDHHPDFDYTNRTGHREGFTQGNVEQMDIKLGIRTLYRACLRSMPLVKHFYLLLLPMTKMKSRIRRSFVKNGHIRDPDAIRFLLHIGWTEFHDIAGMRKTKGAVVRMFGDREDWDVLDEHYTKEEGKLIEERATAAGERTGTQGPYDGHWSQMGQGLAAYYDTLKGRVPRGTTTSKGLFHPMKPDGTNPWEKNMDYEGWWMKNVDPDKNAARKELSGWITQGYIVPKHYASKNRRTYRRFTKDLAAIFSEPAESMYIRSRELLFQMYVREDCPETNRIYAEKKLAMQDDEVLTQKMEETNAIMLKAAREFPNPRMWKTDAFYFRVRHLLCPLELNWAKAPIGMALEKGYNEWVSDEVNHTVINSETFAVVKANRRLNPMAGTWAQFYEEFDPDVPESRRLPWYHAEYDYDKNLKWDERCMRKKKWVRSGDVDFVRPFLKSFVYEAEQHINRIDTVRMMGSMEKRYAAPRIVQLYRALDKRMDIALANQMRSYVGLTATTSAADATKALAGAKWQDFRFQVPAVIYPHGYVQPQLALDGTPIGPIPEQPPRAQPPPPQATAEASA